MAQAGLRAKPSASGPSVAEQVRSLQLRIDSHAAVWKSARTPAQEQELKSLEAQLRKLQAGGTGAAKEVGTPKRIHR